MLSPQLKSARGTCYTLGYSLAEMAIVLAVIGLISGLSLSVGKTMLGVSAIEGTQERLDVIDSALNLFQLKYKRYPCPALPADPPTSATYGQEVTGGCVTACPAGLTCSNNAVIGAVPFKTLQINEEIAYDSWDGKIAYAVDKNNTESSGSNLGSIPIQDINGNEITFSPVLGDAIFVLVSHGTDGKGAYSKSATLVQACGAVGKDVENCNGDDVFVDSRLRLGDIAANYYDDLVRWETQKNVSSLLGPVTSVSAYYHTCAIKSDTTVWCWGKGSFGRLGNNSVVDSNVPVQVQKITDGTPLTGAVQLANAQEETCALLSDGNTWCWGWNDEGEIGDGTIIEKHQAKQSLISDVRQIAGSWNWMYAVKNDSTVWTYKGPSAPYEEVGLSMLKPALMVDDANLHICGVKINGTVWCSSWSTNNHGELGDGTTNVSGSPVQAIGLTNIVGLTTDVYSNCALKTDGTVWCWGDGTSGQLGNGGTADQYTAVQVPGLTNVVMVSAGGSTDYYCALKKDGTLWCWGGNSYGRLGTGDNVPRTTPTQVLTNVKTIIATGTYHVCAQKQDDTIWCWGAGTNGELGNGASNDSLTPVQVLNFP